ncbi:MAG: OadG family protein [Eubacteriales bacterium]|nr:OadG family protein [Eubacteriales bacterium]
MVEKLANGGLVSIIGLITVFAVLVVLWIVLEVMHKIVAQPEKAVESKTNVQAPAPKKAAETKKPQKAVKLAPLPDGDPRDDKQFDAAIMGAIAAYTGAQKFDFKIKSIKKIDG